MPNTSFQGKDFKNSTAMTARGKSISKRYINGVLVEPTGKEFLIQSAGSIFKKQGYSNASACTPESVLQTLGVSPMPASLGRFYSFMQDEPVQTPENPNIVYTDQLKVLKNKKIGADMYFKNAKNPFFNTTDEVPSHSRYRESQRQKSRRNYTNRTNVAASFIGMNLNATGGNLGPFI